MKAFSVFSLAQLPLDDLAAMAAEAGDDSDAMWELVRRMRHHALPVASRVCFNVPDLDDAANAALAVVPAAARAYRASGGSTFLTYAKAAMKNAARAESAHLARQLQTPPAVEVALVASQLSNNSDVDATYRSAFPLGGLTEILAAMPEMSRRMLGLQDAGYRGTEIARLEGIQTPAVSKRLKVAREQARSAIPYQDAA